ncbi:hypothetical protein NYA30BAC_01379 [Halomonas sp. NYA30]
MLEAADLDEESTLQDIRDAVGNAYTATANSVNGALALVDNDEGNAGDFNDAGFNGRSATVQDSLIASGVEQAEKVVDDAEDEVANGVLGALSTLETRTTTLENAIEAEASAEATFDGELARFNAVNNLTAEADGSATPLTLDATNANLLANGDALQIGGNDFAELVNGKWTLVDTFDFDAVSGVDSADDLNGLGAVVEAGNTWASTTQAATNAQESVNSAIERVVQLEQGNELAVADQVDDFDGTAEAGAEAEVTVDLATPGATDAQAVLDARTVLNDLNEAIVEFEAARALDAEAEDFADAITDAQDAITDSEEDGGLGVDLLTEADDLTFADDTATEVAFSGGDEIYLFNAENAQDADGDEVGLNVTGFADAGEDRIFFGEGYDLVQIPEGDDINDNVGDSAALEILWSEDNTGLTLYVETEAFAGNGSSQSDVTEVFLAGVSSDDINFSGGYLTAGEPA